MWARGKQHLQARVASLFYSHGLFCASHPFAIISLVITIILMTSYPLTTLPLPGNAPLQYRTPLDGYKVPPSSLPATQEEGSADKRPRWYLGPPMAYILQVIVKSTVSPWEPKKHIQTDAFRAPLSKAFDIVAHIDNFQKKKSTEAGEKSVSLGDVCLHVYETVAQKKAKHLLPEYNCLTVSPAHFWSNSKIRFDEDATIVDTVTRRFGQPLDVPPSIRDLLFGVPLKDTGIRRYHLRNRQRVISYAVTVLFKTYDEKYVSALRDHLHHLYPLRLVANSTMDRHADHVYFKDVNYFVEYTPLLVAYTVVFLYLYFSVRKIEMVKSKWGLALSAVVTVVSSLLMSVGICTMFGMTPSLNGSEIFPYLVVIIGLENVLVVTKSVVSTPVHLDVKLRVAQGLRKEGWSIFKNLMTELLILAVGFFTFVPAIQEFSLFAVVGLLSDFFLQMFFFTTVLSIDIRRMELADLQKQSVLQSLGDVASDLSTGGKTGKSGQPANSVYGQKPIGLHKMSSKVSRMMPASRGSFTDEFSTLDPIRKAPKRVQFMNYWARSRFMQRAIMVCVVIWIVLIVYKTGLMEHLAEVALRNASHRRYHPTNAPTTPPTSDDYHRDLPDNSDLHTRMHDHTLVSDTQAFRDGSEKYVNGLLTHRTVEKWRELSYNHWPTLLGYYNITMRGRYITILPSVHLSLVIPGDDAVAMRNLEEATAKQYAGNEGHDQDFVLGSSDPSVIPPTNDQHLNSNISTGEQQLDYPPHPALNLTLVIRRLFREPQSRTELVTTVLLGVASFILFTYCMTTLYRCMCSRNYDKWRGRRDKDRRGRKHTSPYYKQIRETVPLVLESHLQEVECLVTDGPLIISACLGGQLCVWDSMSGECITSVFRKRDPPFELRSPAVGSSINDSTQDLREVPTGMPKLVPPADPSPCPATTTTSTGGEAPSLRYVPAIRPPSHSRHRSEDFVHRRTNSGDFIMVQQMQQQMQFQPIQQKPPQQQPQAPTLVEYNTSKFPSRNLVDIMPDLTGTIDTDFPSLAASSPSQLSLPTSSPQLSPTAIDAVSSSLSSSPCVETTSSGSASKVFDFSRFEKPYDEHRQMTAEKVAYMALRHPTVNRNSPSRGSDQPPESGRTRSLSQGDCPDPVPTDAILFDRDTHDDLAPAVWCIACQDSLIVTGCGNGRIEFWDGLTGALKFVHQDGSSGVTAICLVGHKVIAARLNGVVDFLELETSRTPTMSGTTTPSSLHSRAMPGGHRRTSSGSSWFGADYKCWDDVIHIKMIDSVCAHQRPINILQSEGGRVITASQDHTLKVYRVEDSLRLYTLHGHTGGVTALFLDKVAPLAAASGAEDGVVRLWDLMTGACVHKLRGHVATVTSVMCTSLYVISVGMDDQLCVWERCKGHLLHYIPSEPGYCNTVSMLTSNLMVTGGQGCLHLWDVSKGEVLRAVTLGDSNPSVFIKHLRVIGNATVVCDYGNQLRVIHFPAVLEKAD